MPPKIRITREEIVRAATELVRREGANALNARSVAAELGCSTQPIFSNYGTMEELKAAVIVSAESVYRDYAGEETARGEYPPYKAGGMAYIRFAAEETELFRLLFMRDRSGETIPEETELGADMEALVRGNTGLDGDTAKLFHLEMWAFVHGIAVIIATDYLKLDRELVSRMLTDCYTGLRKAYGRE